LFAKYPNNTNEAQVLLKVVTLNDLYSTQIPIRASDGPNVFDIARCIPNLKLDQAFNNRSLEIVNVNQHYPVSGEEKDQPLFVRHKVCKLAQSRCVPDVGPKCASVLDLLTEASSSRVEQIFRRLQAFWQLGLPRIPRHDGPISCSLRP